jgi:hypothetical protein
VIKKGAALISKYYQIGEIIMTTTLEQLIEKLQSLVESGVDPKIPVILEYVLDDSDCPEENYGIFNPQKFFSKEGQDPITFRYVGVKEFTNSENDSDRWYHYNEWLDSPEQILNEKKILVLSSPSFKYGTEEDVSL